MSRSIRSYPEKERPSVIIRRLIKNAGGIGTWAARDAARHLGVVIKEKTE